MRQAELSLTPTKEQLRINFERKYRKPNGAFPSGPGLWFRHGYFSPEDFYETIVSSLVSTSTSWADIGCGRHVFPSNPSLAQELAQRAKFFFGIDPDDNIKDNKLVHAYFHGMVEDCDTTHRFDLITMRMVAEHIVNPEQAIGKISTLLAPKGKLIIYTPNKWSPMSLVADLVPFRLHHPFKRLIWQGEARDTFPTAYKLNTRPDLLRHCNANGLSELHFQYLDDCRIFSSYLWVNRMELWMCKQLVRVGLHYPETCILTVYEKQ